MEATWPKEVQELANNFLKDFIQVNIGSEDLIASENVKQEFEFASKLQKKRNCLRYWIES